MLFLTDYPQIQIVRDMAKRRKKEVYLVGGFLRDFLLGKDCRDFDFAVEKDAIGFARMFANKIKGAFILLDQEHGCARVARKQGGKIYTFDFADFRAPTLKKDLAHRDFTINTFSACINDVSVKDKVEDVICDFRKGKPDLSAKRIRMVSVKAFKEDPLRLLRAFSLRAGLGFKIEQKTLTQMRKDKDLIRDVSYERIREELFKVLESPRAAENLKAMDRMGLLVKIIPQIAVMYGVKQGTYHHLDVWPHSLETVVQVEKLIKEHAGDRDVMTYFQEPIAGERSRLALLKLAAVVHDIGKPETRKKEPGRLTFHAHERVGRGITKHVANLLKLSTKERVALQDMVLWHLRPGYLSNFKRPSEKAIFRYMRDTKEETVSIAFLSLADQRATCGPLTTDQDQAHHEKICLDLVKRYFKKKKEKPFVRLINGDDLIKTLKLKPSPLFSKILNAVEEAQVVGKIKTKKEALSYARKILMSADKKR